MARQISDESSTFSFINCPIKTASLEQSMGDSIEARGAVFTRTEVVDFMLDVCGYKADKPLYLYRVLEPSFGRGDFLLPIICRLLEAWKNAGTGGGAYNDLAMCIVAIELHHETYRETAQKVLQLLLQHGVTEPDAEKLVKNWLKQGDFLLSDLGGLFDHVIGNPPYVRQELIPAPLLDEYKRRYQTIYDRADLYVPFIERSLNALNSSGQLTFICADRWMKNKYGSPLRKLVAENFHLKIYVDMTGTQAFHSDVDAYPAITVISREEPGTTLIGYCNNVEKNELKALSAALTSGTPKDNELVRELNKVTNGSEPWLLGSQTQMELIRRIERDFPSLESVGCKVGIGVATGADKILIGRDEELPIESDRKVPLATTRDIISGTVKWSGKYVVNPYNDDGGLVDLVLYPMLSFYLGQHRQALEARHCAKKSPKQWYKTIDRITPYLTQKPKLLIPDIRGEAHVVYEEGKLYPHHNLYFVTSDTWDLRALQAVLLSSVSRLFISMYSTKMKGGYLRFQAQYIRRIRLPEWDDVPLALRKKLASAAERYDLHDCEEATFELYKLNEQEVAAIGGK